MVVQPTTSIYDISYFRLLNNNLLSRNNIGMAQRLSNKAKAAKLARDKKTAMTPRRRAMKAENQRKRREAKKNGKNLNGKDYDHKTGRFTSIKANRGNRGQGTKKEKRK
jgi:hypothetical protein